MEVKIEMARDIAMEMEVQMEIEVEEESGDGGKWVPNTGGGMCPAEGPPPLATQMIMSYH